MPGLAGTCFLIGSQFLIERGEHGYIYYHTYFVFHFVFYFYFDFVFILCYFSRFFCLFCMRHVTGLKPCILACINMQASLCMLCAFVCICAQNKSSPARAYTEKSEHVVFGGIETQKTNTKHTKNKIQNNKITKECIEKCWVYGEYIGITLG